MAFYYASIHADVRFYTEVEADNEDEAREKAMIAWRECDLNEMEFDNEFVSNIAEM